MPFAISVLLIAQAATADTSSPPIAIPIYGPPTPKTVKKASASRPDPCRDRAVEPGVILVCGKRDEYRIDPDLLAAQKLFKDQTKPKPKPSEKFVDTTCQVVGVMGCINKPTIDVLGAISTGVAMAKALSKGEGIGKFFTTTPELSEYQLYRQVKREREIAETGTSSIPAP